MADLSAAGAGGAAGPVRTGVIGRIGECPAIQLRPGQDVVFLRSVEEAVDQFAFLVARRVSRVRMLDTSGIQRIAVQIGQVLRDSAALGVVPGACADPVARVDGGFAVGGLRAR